MDLFSLVVNVLSYVPLVDLFANEGATSLPELAYDVGQLMLGFRYFAKGAVVVSKATPWKQDDTIAVKALAFFTSAVELIARLPVELPKEKPRSPMG
jgi:hypothetical protein